VTSQTSSSPCGAGTTIDGTAAGGELVVPSRPPTPVAGLAGMREWVMLFGGQVESGPAGPGFQVRARIPVRAPE
jgi:signal transduction histidine kinase